MDNDMNWNYDDRADNSTMGWIDVDAVAIPLVLEEARKRRDGNVIGSSSGTAGI